MVKQEAQFKGLLWAMESMRFHRVEKVVFALHEEVLVNVISRPAAWPSFRYHSMVLGQVLSSFQSWKTIPQIEESFLLLRVSLMIADSNLMWLCLIQHGSMVFLMKKGSRPLIIEV